MVAASSPAVALAVVTVVLALVLLRAGLCALGLHLERRRAPAVSPGTGPALSVVIPLHGWDERFLELLDGLAQAAARYGSPVEVVVVADDDHPRRPELAHRPLVRVVAPAFLGDGLQDKVRRLRTGVSVARHPYVLLMDSDVLVDPDFLLRVVAPHLAQPSLRLTFALPAYRGARAAGDQLLGAFTLHHNLLLYFLGWWLLRVGTSIGPSQLVRNDDGALAALLEGIKDVLIDDHALGRSVALRGEEVRAHPFEVRVHASDASLAAAARQVLRWMVGSRTVAPLVDLPSALWMGAAVGLTSAGVTLLAAGAGALAGGAPGAGQVLLAGGAAVMVLEGVLYALLEAQLFRASPRLAAVLAVPAFMLVQPFLFAVSLTRRDIRWRGRREALVTAPIRTGN